MPGLNILGLCGGSTGELGLSSDCVRECDGRLANSRLLAPDTITLEVSWSGHTAVSGNRSAEVDAEINKVLNRVTGERLREVLNGSVPLTDSEFAFVECACCDKKIVSILFPEIDEELEDSFNCLNDLYDLFLGAFISIEYDFCVTSLFVNLTCSQQVEFEIIGGRNPSMCSLTTCFGSTSGHSLSGSIGVNLDQLITSSPFEISETTFCPSYHEPSDTGTIATATMKVWFS